MWRKFLMVAVLVVGLAGLAYAAAEWQEDGVKVNKSEALNFVGGPNVSGNGVVTDVDFSTISGDMTTDSSIYFSTAATNGVGLWLSQPDGGCSYCAVDAAGTTFACTNQTCPSNM